MRRRLTVFLFLPSLALLLMLGLAYVGSAARADQQEVYVDRLRDASYLAIVARQSLAADDPELVEGDLARYEAVYGIEAAVLDSSGNTWASSGLDVSDVDARAAALSGQRGESSPSAVPWQVDDIVITEPVYEGGDLVGAVVTSSDVDDLSRGIWRNWGLIALFALVLIAGAVVIANRTAAWVLRPVRRVDRAMARIGRGHLEARIPESVGPPELREVTYRFNQMAERVEHLVHQQREFVHNASHELRNPLTALTLRVEELELTLPSELKPEVAAVRAETVRLRRILDALLLLADDTSIAADAVSADIFELVAARVTAWRHLAPDRTIELAAPPHRPARGTINTTAVECALDAVVDNALKFSPRVAPVEVSVEVTDGSIEVVVRDHGPGIPHDELSSATKRFWRSPEHSTVRGSGLGLAIAAELLEPGGDVALELPENGGLLVRFRIPEDRSAAR